MVSLLCLHVHMSNPKLKLVRQNIASVDEPSQLFWWIQLHVLSNMNTDLIMYKSCERDKNISFSNKLYKLLFFIFACTYKLAYRDETGIECSQQMSVMVG